VKALGLGRGAIVKAVLADWRTAPVDARMSGALAFLEKLTLTPEAVGPEDVRTARAAGVSMDRLADAFGFEVARANELKRGEWILRWFGYARMSVPG
jgi:alkylhydroperoxidase family enzyme